MPINKNQERAEDALSPSKRRSGHAALRSTSIVTCIKDVLPEEVAWLWRPRIALGQVSLISGDPGLGKSMLTLDMAAHVTHGRSWPDGSQCPKGEVILLGAEDDIANTIRPRLEAAGADISRVHTLNAVCDTKGGEIVERVFSMRDDVGQLGNVLIEHPACRLVVIDPLAAYLHGTDSHSDAKVRQMLAPFAQLAAQCKVAIVCVTHPNKSSTKKGIYGVTGSLGFVAAVRAVHTVEIDPKDARRRLFRPLKNNLGNDNTGLAFSILKHGNGEPYLSWEKEPIAQTADDMLPDSEPRTEREAAAEWLLEALRNGPVAV